MSLSISSSFVSDLDDLIVMYSNRTGGECLCELPGNLGNTHLNFNVNIFPFDLQLFPIMHVFDSRRLVIGVPYSSAPPLTSRDVVPPRPFNMDFVHSSPGQRQIALLLIMTRLGFEDGPRSGEKSNSQPQLSPAGRVSLFSVTSSRPFPVTLVGSLGRSITFTGQCQGNIQSTWQETTESRLRKAERQDSVMESPLSCGRPTTCQP
jgi:hypothetical protein